MSKNKSQFICSNCDNISTKWSGQCSNCNSWDTLSEYNNQIKISQFNSKNILSLEEKINIHNISDNITDSIRYKTDIEELDRVLGGGLVPSSVILIGGDPGVGKSTLMLQILNNFSKKNINNICFSGEESLNQIQIRSKRLNLSNNNIKISTSTEVTQISNYLRNNKDIELVIIDSIQTSYISELSSPPGSINQLRNSTLEFIDLAKNSNIIFILIGHVTKEGQIAGPKLIEHMVDTVLYFEGEKNTNYRILRAHKNRYGPISELALFEMKESGLEEINNPSKIFLSEYNSNNSGTAIFPYTQGSKTILLELQSLVSPSYMASPRRAVVGWDNNRLAIILAVLGSRCKLNFSQQEVYFNVTGGLKITEPAADLAAAASLISSLKNKPLPDKTVIFGELGLSGEIRSVPDIDKKLNEASKLGFKKAITPKLRKDIKKYDNIEIIELNHINDIINIL